MIVFLPVELILALLVSALAALFNFLYTASTSKIGKSINYYMSYAMTILAFIIICVGIYKQFV